MMREDSSTYGKAVRASIAIAMVFVAACRGDEPTTAGTPPPPIASPTPARATPAADFGLYVLALSWAPTFCCSHPDKEECARLSDGYAGTHLTLHGLWPNYRDDEARGRDTYPQFCGDYARCRSHHDRSCAPDPASLPEEMRELAPGYVGDHDFLADHEWPKHGSCTGLDPSAYFRAALSAMHALPGNGTPDAVTSAIGRSVELEALAGAFGVPRDSVLLGCEADCRLAQVSVCLAHEPGGAGKPVACPRNTTQSSYDNGCVTRGCTRVTIPAAGSCAIAPRDQRPHGHQGRACNHPGQGPACASDTECTAAGFTRCARSGCCTSQP